MSAANPGSRAGPVVPDCASLHPGYALDENRKQPYEFAMINAATIVIARRRITAAGVEVFV